MRVLIIEPYFTGSHADWAKGYQAHSSHNVDILKLPGRYWKWRMHGGAVTLARKYIEEKHAPDVILATDMLDVSVFLALTRKKTAGIPVALYFHENQLTYPWSPTDRDLYHQRDKHYGFINFTSALAADRVFFNSHYHHDVFFDGLRRLLKFFPDFNEMEAIAAIQKKSSVLALGLDLARFDRYGNSTKNQTPLLLWNHRWEHDKNPEAFFAAIFDLADRGLVFQVAVLGENFKRCPHIFLEAKSRLGKRIAHYGYAKSFAEYARWLQSADILPVTSNQDFFGASIIEAIYCDVYPLLPNRLTYPELLPKNRHDPSLYKTQEEFLQKLAAAITDIDTIRHEDDVLKKSAASFDWARMANEYDTRLSAITTDRPVT